MTSKTKYAFKAKIWKFKGKGGWHFITLPKIVSKKIRKLHGLDEEGWGRLKTQAEIGNSQWNTAIWFDSKIGSYLLPVKSDVRKKENLQISSLLQVALYFQY